MPKTVQKQRPAPKEQAVVEDTKVETKQVDLTDIDALLDEIDSVLEENAEEFIRGYVQKGGQ